MLIIGKLRMTKSLEDFICELKKVAPDKILEVKRTVEMK